MEIPAGWYSDPGLVDQLRYWDGQQWTPHVRARSVSGPFLGADPALTADESPSTPGQVALPRGTRMRRARVGLVLLIGGMVLIASGIALSGVAPWLGTQLIEPGVVVGISGLSLLLVGAFGRARSHRSTPAMPTGGQAVMMVPSRRIYRGMLAVSAPGVLAMLFGALATRSAGETSGSIVLMALAGLFAAMVWYGMWGLSSGNRLLADPWGMRFGTPVGTKAFPWHRLERIGHERRGAATRVGYVLTAAHGVTSSATPSTRVRLLPLGYQIEDAAFLSLLLAEHRAAAAPTGSRTTHHP